MTDVDALKRSVSIVAVAKQLGIRMTRVGGTWAGRCPWHDDHDPSFYAWTGDDGIERVTCHPCGVMEDAVGLVQLRTESDFPDAVAAVEEMQSEGLVDALPESERLERKTIDLREYALGAHASVDSEGLIPALFSDRDLRPDPEWARTVFRLGVTDGEVTIPHYSADGAVVGVKRRVLVNGKWQKLAKAGSRLQVLYNAWHSTDAQNVIICEGESDVWSVVWDLEQQGRTADVLGLPSGVTAKPQPEWLGALRGKDVTLLFDADRAGGIGLQMWSEFLDGEAKSVLVARLPAGKDASSSDPGDLRRALDAAAPPEEPPNPLDEHALTFDQILSIPPPQWQVEDLIQDAPLTLIYAHRASFKSFLAIDLGLHAALGREWHGRAVKKERVLYVAAEGTGGIGARVQAWAKYHAVNSVPDFYLYPRPVNFMKTEQVRHVKRYVRDHEISLVVLDTLRKSMSGGDENSATETGLVMTNAGALESSVWIIHHTARTGNARGSTVLEDDVDNMLKLTRDKDGPSPMTALLTGEKTKDGAEEDGLVLTLEVVEFMDRGTGEKGASLVIVAVESTGEAKESMRNADDRKIIEAVVRVVSGADVAPTDVDEAVAKLLDKVPRKSVTSVRERYTAEDLLYVEQNGKNRNLRARSRLRWALQ